MSKEYIEKAGLLFYIAAVALICASKLGANVDVGQMAIVWLAGGVMYLYADKLADGNE